MSFKHLTLLMSMLLMLIISGCGEEEKTNQQQSSPTEASQNGVYSNEGLNLLDSSKHPEVTIEMSNGGIIKVELYPEIAPNTVSNFVSLAQEGYYDGLIFHRVIPGFMIQGGDPEGTGMGGPGYSIKGEFNSNGFDNPIVHTRGVISMARSMDKDSAGSQFFIMGADAPSLDGEYAAFGAVTEGLEIVDVIINQERDSNDKPLNPLSMKKVTVDLRDSELQPLEKVEETPYSNAGLNFLDSSKHPEVTIEMSNGGIIKMELYPEFAPNTVSNFVSLAQSGYYDGLIFHRVIPGFMIQGGDPQGSGMGGPGYSIKGEFTSNGFDNPLVHTRGVLSMARSMDKNSAGSQFFIMQADAPHLDGDYAAFGEVTEGLDVVDEIVAQERDGNDKPLNPLSMKKVTVDLRNSELQELVKQ